ncbi:hypothetical protein D6858_15380 [Tsuneonella suprasediminis]|uniref:Terminase small subunit n=1 Tax=Tsuneonella suprasediminis TaxID=2306996 RepID=A0A419QYU5_9SPHN|nr:hypothetical protein [Tsuneonella suprasediminis]RJX65676.1 hypothetical protein D6858_15380 [Tsuneonella suprasediminis]
MTASQIDPSTCHRRTRQQWEQPFLQSLARLKFITRAAEEAGIAAATVHARKRRDPDFARAIKRAVAQAAPPIPGVCEVASRQRPRHTPARRVAHRPAQPGRKWREQFIQRLGETSNVAASAAHAHISTREVYALRRSDPTFAAAWQSALYEGYLNLEMEVLGHLRDPAPDRKLDVANALRLLSAHKDTVSKERAVRTHISKAELRESLARKVEAMRRKVEAERATDAELDQAAENTSEKEPRDD